MGIIGVYKSGKRPSARIYLLFATRVSISHLVVWFYTVSSGSTRYAPHAGRPRGRTSADAGSHVVLVRSFARGG